MSYILYKGMCQCVTSSKFRKPSPSLSRYIENCSFSFFTHSGSSSPSAPSYISPTGKGILYYFVKDMIT